MRAATCGPLTHRHDPRNGTRQCLQFHNVHSHVNELEGEREREGGGVVAEHCLHGLLRDRKKNICPWWHFSLRKITMVKNIYIYTNTHIYAYIYTAMEQKKSHCCCCCYCRLAVPSIMSSIRYGEKGSRNKRQQRVPGAGSVRPSVCVSVCVCVGVAHASY